MYDTLCKVIWFGFSGLTRQASPQAKWASNLPVLRRKVRNWYTSSSTECKLPTGFSLDRLELRIETGIQHVDINPIDIVMQVTIFVTDVIRHSTVDPFAFGEHIPSEAYPPVTIDLTPVDYVSWAFNNNTDDHLRHRLKSRRYHLPINRGTLLDLGGLPSGSSRASGRKTLVE